ncbi:hypothetical protein J5N97_005466 [Dioscorea zingiberensis]|uniref:Embryo defective n=1 Tax=Dioscorea zingiberensis TaxID=325984 RepID=A0A9D5D871_9LILI|nr:hypothetical protein J5N97_005466 [Dioscorea zingiberensis]
MVSSTAAALGFFPVGLARFYKNEVRSQTRMICYAGFQDPCCANFGLSSSLYHRMKLSPSQSHRRRHLVPRGINLTAGNYEKPEKMDISGVINALEKQWKNLPQPIKNFPWTKAALNFYHLIFELTCSVAKYLCLPLLAVSSLSEMSYCAHERKMRVIPIPFLLGFAVAGVLKDTAKDLYPDLKEGGGLPRHLLLVAIFFVLLKLPGPYYPYWGRLIIPHFANGALWSIAWSSFMWLRQRQGSPATTLETSHTENLSEERLS